jgi:protein SCO1
MTRILRTAGLAAVALLASFAPPAPAPAASSAAPARGAFPNPEVVTQDGRHVRFFDDLVKGRTVMIDFAYTRCNGRCPAAIARLVQVQHALGERFGKDVTMVTVSLDPENDTPEAARRYVAASHGRPGWTYVTGAREDLEALRRFLGFYDRRPEVDRDKSQHATLVAIGSEARHRWITIPGLLPAGEIIQVVNRVQGLAPGGPPPPNRAALAAVTPP